MAKLFAIYQQPADTAAFDDYYFNKHLPLAKTLPGLRSYEVTSGDVMGMAGKHGAYLVAVLEFDSMAAIQAAMASAQGQATAADLANFAGAGVDIMVGETRRV
ncbi:EthD family reductase [Polaromonas naphthalenivorans]|uniref:Ethyl tert-butyl ether degradation EthD n=1 Tax=Polaromonas naphthalenivorans (strain CJ2) TaxID=365044 RepID=A1VKY1_POLNA|nr:EthD family reductase [Polaromonas naphthalenivorans]ABM36309.1 Ethyl tert-butyl ether degradation EthD [Polaromonas naphthalenivorans CJ2]